MNQIERNLRQTIAELALVSHGTISKMGASPGEDDAVFPPGGAARKDDRETEHPLKSHLHFQRRLDGCLQTARAKLLSCEDRAGVDRVIAWRDGILTALLADATTALEAWRHTPIRDEPKYGSPQWKKWIAASKESNKDLARRFNVTSAYIGQVRKNYAS